MVKQVEWRNRIVESGEEAPDQLLANPFNARIHPKPQQDALSGVLNSVGWIAPVIVNQRTGHVIDGHLRVSLALSKGEKSIPVDYVDLDENEEKILLASFDYIGSMAVYDREAVDTLLKQVNSNDNDVQVLLSDLQSTHGLDTDGSDTEGTRGGDEIEHISIDTVYASDNLWGIPSLDLKLQGEHIVLPVTKYGTQSRKQLMTGTYYFYTEDYKFSALWEIPDTISLSGCTAIVEPNYSTNNQMSRAQVLWLTYQKRWLARYWQDYGIRVWVDMNIEARFFDIGLYGVPKDWKAFANRAYSNDTEPLQLAYDYLVEQGYKDIRYLVIGGRESIEALCLERGWLWIPEQSAVVKDRYAVKVV